MAEIHSNRVKESQLDTIIEQDVIFTGDMKFKDPLMIKGTFSGNLTSDSDLFIEKDAKVVADIIAGRIEIRGEVKGDISATESVFLYSSAKVTGDIVAPKIKMEQGCFFSGQCKMEVTNG